MYEPLYAEDGGAAMGTGEPVSGGDDGQGAEPEQPEAGGEDGGQAQDTKPERTFTQTELDRIVTDRLRRDRVNREPGEADKLIADLAKTMGITPQEYLQRARDNYARRIREAEEAKYRDSGIDPSLIDERVNNHPVVKKAEEYLTRQQQEAQQKETFNSEAADFLSFCKESGVNPPDEMPPEVWRLKEESRLQGREMSITEAFLRLKYPSLRTDAEQKVINEMKTSQQASPGALSQGAAAEAKGFSSMSDDEFAKFAEEVEAGIRKI